MLCRLMTQCGVMNMGIKGWTIAIVVLGALDAFLYTASRQDVAAEWQSLQRHWTVLSSTFSNDIAAGGEHNQTTLAIGTNAHKSNPQLASPPSTDNQSNVAGADETAADGDGQAVVNPSGVMSGIHPSGQITVQWYVHDNSVIHMETLQYDGGNQLSLRGSYNHFNGDLVALVGQFNSRKTSVIHWWTYSIPVNNGQIDATITLPYHGLLQVSVAPEEITAAGDFTTSSAFTYTNVTNHDATLSEKRMALLQSWLINYNESPEFKTLAQQIVSPIITEDKNLSAEKQTDDEIRAISNWVSGHIAYNWPAYDENKTPWQQVTETLAIRVGVCNDESALAAALLRSIGIPSEVVDGEAVAPGTQGPHQWNRTWDGTQWILFDPTWDQVYYESQTHAVSLPQKIDDNYFDLSPKVFDQTHLNGKVADW